MVMTVQCFVPGKQQYQLCLLQHGFVTCYGTLNDQNYYTCITSS